MYEFHGGSLSWEVVPHRVPSQGQVGLGLQWRMGDSALTDCPLNYSSSILDTQLCSESQLIHSSCPDFVVFSLDNYAIKTTHMLFKTVDNWLRVRYM